MKKNTQLVEAKIKITLEAMQKAGLRPAVEEHHSTNRTLDLPREKTTHELRTLLPLLQNRVEAMMNEKIVLERSTKAVQSQIDVIAARLHTEMDGNMERENKLLTAKSHNPYEVQREVADSKRRQIDLANRVKTLQNLPLYKNDEGGASTQIKLKVLGWS